MEAASVPWRPLGELFVSRGLVTQEELERALAEQAATGKRLGEILVDRGLVSGPDLTAALMDQLGVEVSKEEGFGSGLWAEIKRRHRRVRHDDEAAEDEPEPVAAQPEISLVPPFVDEPEADAGPEPEPEPVAFEPEPVAFEPEPVAVEHEPVAVEPVPQLEPELEPVAVEPEPEPEVAPEPVEVDPELEAELAEIKAEYEAPAPIEPEPESQPEPMAAFEFEPEPVALTENGESEDLRRELDEARVDLARLQDMLADAMTALTALTSESADEHTAV